MKNSNDIFKIGNLNIGWVDSDFPTRFPNVEFAPRQLGTFKTLIKTTTITEMLSEKLAIECELGDVLAFLENPSEGTKDGYSNIFIIKNSSFVVSVRWGSDGSDWFVFSWSRGGLGWYAGGRVFSPATTAGFLGHSDPIALEIRNLTKEVKRLADTLQKPKKVIKKKRV